MIDLIRNPDLKVGAIELNINEIYKKRNAFKSCISKEVNIPEWGNRITTEERIFCPLLI